MPTVKEKIAPITVQRDDLGHWTHPAWPQDGDENAVPKAWFDEQGLEIFLVEFEYDAPQELLDSYFDDGDPDCSKWTPTKPDGDGWFVFSIHETEDGPVCVWLREKPAG